MIAAITFPTDGIAARLTDNAGSRRLHERVLAHMHK